MSEIKVGTTLTELQEYVAEHWQERGFDGNTAIDECLLLAEEVGELAKAIRHTSGIGTDPNSHVGKLAYEIADIIWVTTAIANMYGINVEEAVREKETINHGRTWGKRA